MAGGAGHERRASADHAGATALAAAKLGQELEASVDVRHDDVLQALAEQAGEGCRQLFRCLDPIGDHAEHGAVFAIEQRARSGAHAFQPAVQLFERAQAIATQAELVLGAVHRALAVELACAQRFHLLLERDALGCRQALALGQLRHALFERALLGIERGQLTGDRVALGRQLVAPGVGFGDALGLSIQARFCRGRARARLRQLLAQALHLFVGAGFSRAQVGERRVFTLRVSLAGLLVARQLGEPLGEVSLFAAQLRDAHHELFALGARCGQALLEVLEPIAAALDLGRERGDIVVRLESRTRRLVAACFDAGGFLARQIQLGFRLGEPGAGLLGAGARDRESLAVHALHHDQLEQPVRRFVQRQIFELAPVLQEALGLGDLTLERSARAIDLADDVRHAQEVLAREIHLALGLTAALLVLGDAGGLFDEQAPIFRTRAHDLTDAALLHDRVGLGTDTGAEEQIRDVAQADLSLVDQVFAGAVTEQPARDRDLGIVPVLRREQLRVRRIGVVERERDLREAVRAARLGAVEDHVFHRAAAQVLGALLAHAPADRVDDVGFAAAVGPDDADDVVIEVDHGPVHEGLETRDLQLLDVHRWSSPRASPNAIAIAQVRRCRPRASGPRL